MRTGVLYSDNVGRTADNEVDSGIGVLGMQLWGYKPVGRLRYSALGNVSYLDVFNKQFPGYALGNVGGTLDFDIVPTAFEWNSKASFEEVRQNLGAALGPTNRESITTLGTGPTFRAEVTNTLDAVLKGNYERSYFSERNFNSETKGGRFDLDHSISRDSHFGVGVTYDDVTYTSDVAAGSFDFTRREAFLEWKATGKRTTINAEVGAAKLQGSGFETTGPLARIDITRRLSPYLSASLNFSRSFPTSPSAFSPSSFIVSGSSAAQFVGTDNSIATATARRQTVVGTQLALNRPRTLAQFQLNYSSEVGVQPGVEDDRRYYQGIFSITHFLTPRTSGGLFASYLRDREVSQTIRARESSYGVSLGTLLTTSFSLEAAIRRASRSDATALGRYSEWVGGLFFVWGNGPVTPTNDALFGQ